MSLQTGVQQPVQSFVEVRLGIWKLGCDLSGGTQVARVRIELALPDAQCESERLLGCPSHPASPPYEARGVCSQQRLRQHLGWTSRHESAAARLCGACMQSEWAAFGQPRAATLLFIGRRALLRSQGDMRRRQDLGWTFRLGTRWASGRKARGGVLELTWELTLGCGSRAQSQRAGGTEARGRAGVWGSRLRGDRSASARCDEFQKRVSVKRSYGRWD